MLGIDEAGRGAVVGPLVIAGVLISKEDKLSEIRDSKELSPNKRKELFKLITKEAEDYIYFIISSDMLNREMKKYNLNEIEISRIVQIINLFYSKNLRVYIDAMEANTEKLKQKILSKLKNKEITLIAENYADKKYKVVGAASIIAKVIRDREIEKLHKKYGFFGSGYPSDERTIRFLKNADREVINRIARLEWITMKNILNSRNNKKLSEY
ncbi:MAG: ribonuclease HII [Candidatus Aenigmarchaeota archaeon ex4484_56]|nr:MAG: ribonuclease HII [Candidatus Aenigmarchaeota archaeon ex4484_56]